MKTIPMAIRMATPIAMSKDCKYPDRVLDRIFKQIPTTQSDLSSQCTLGDILRLIGDASYTRQLPGGAECPKERLWLAAFGISKGDRKAKSARPGTPSGLLQVDVDHYSDSREALYEAQQRLMDLPYIVASFVSPSGTGVKALAAIEKVAEYDDARLLGIACTKAICDHLGLIGYREGTSKGADSTWARLPKELQERFGESHIDFSVATDPRKGCFIPAKDSNVLIKDESETLEVWTTRDTHKTLTGYYLDGQEHPFTDQAKTTTPAFFLPPAELAFSAPVSGDRWEKYVVSAIADALSTLENAGPGAHHQAAIAFGRSVAKFRDHIDTTDVFARADAIIDGWCPAASAPDVEKRTIREMDQYQDRIDKDTWLRDHPSTAPSSPVSVSQAEYVATKIQSLVVHDIWHDEQPVESRGWSEEAVAKLMVDSFLEKYRLLPSGEGIAFSTGEILSRAQVDKIQGIVWFYADEKRREKKITLTQAFSLVRKDVFATPVHRPDMAIGAFDQMRATPTACTLTQCVNVSGGVPTYGLDLASMVTEKTKQEAKIIADFAVSRFIDRENYPDQREAKEHAIQESAYYFRLVSQAVLDPLDRPPCAIAVLSPQKGTGKSTLMMDIPSLLAGPAFGMIDQKDLENASALRFKWGAFAGKIFGTFDDFKDPKDSLAATLRSFITSPLISVETKGVQAHDEDNFCRLLISSNSREFLKELNSGTESERRWHLFSLKNKMLGDSSCDAALKIVRYYSKRSRDRKIIPATDPELQSFRAAVVLEFKARADTFESSGGTILLEQALETAEFLKQKDLGEDHNPPAMAAGDALAQEPGYCLSYEPLIEHITHKTGWKGIYARSLWREIGETGWFEKAKSGSTRLIRLTPKGIKKFVDLDDEDPVEIQLHALQDKTPREKMAVLKELSDAHKISFIGDDEGSYAIKIHSTGKELEMYVGFESPPVKYYQPTFYHDYKGDSDDDN